MPIEQSAGGVMITGESIKDYRDEYMQISAVRIRGDRASRRRAYG